MIGFLPLVLAVATMALSGAMFFAALMNTRNARLEIDRRVRLAQANDIAISEVSAEAGHANWLDDRVRAAFAVGIARQWGMTLGALALLGFAFLASGAVWIVAHSALNVPPWFALPLAAAAFVIAPRLLLQREQAKVEAQFMNFFPDAIEMMVRMLRAGLPVTAAIGTVGKEAPPPVDAVFRSIADQVDIGIPLEASFNLEARRLGLADFRFFAIAVALQRTTGGNLASTLEILSDIMRKRRAMRLKAHSTTAEVRLSAYVLGAMPFLITGLLLLLRPNYLAPLIADRRGNIIVGSALALLVLGFLTMRRLMRSVNSAVGGGGRF